MFKRICEDIKAVRSKDPAARGLLEILLCYPGMHAIWIHRISHRLYRWKLFFCARLLSHFSRCLTGVEIHPGAKIGRGVVIDHGMGIVIGETSEIGDDCLLYQGTTLGGTSLSKGKRHPTLGKDVVVGANSNLLGPIHIGDGARIGAGSTVVKNVKAGETVVGLSVDKVKIRTDADSKTHYHVEE